MTEFKNKLNDLTKSAGFEIEENKTIITIGMAILFFTNIDNLERAIRILSKEFAVSPVIDQLSLGVYSKS